VGPTRFASSPSPGISTALLRHPMAAAIAPVPRTPPTKSTSNTSYQPPDPIDRPQANTNHLSFPFEIQEHRFAEHLCCRGRREGWRWASTWSCWTWVYASESRPRRMRLGRACGGRPRSCPRRLRPRRRYMARKTVEPLACDGLAQAAEALTCGWRLPRCSEGARPAAVATCRACPSPADEMCLASQWVFRSRFTVLETPPHSCRGDETNPFSLLLISCKKSPDLLTWHPNKCA
jgi:hypothetical protein